jgi:hypothetical protein
MGANLYPEPVSSIRLSSSNNSSLWPISNSGGEVDLREEFYELLYGSSSEVAKGRPGLLRRMRTDSDGDLIQCPCVDDITGEPDIDTFCPYCWGEGYIWDEEWITYYKRIVSSQEGLVRKNQPHQPGLSNIPFAFFYLEYNVLPTVYDIVIEVSLDEDGYVNTPISRSAHFKIATPESFRSDNGRIEYWRVAATKDSVLSKWQG